MNVKLSLWDRVADFDERLDGNVKSLVPLKAARVEDDQSAIGLPALPRRKNIQVHIIDEC